MHQPRSTSKYLACLIEHAGGRLWLSFGLMVVVGLLEGVALLILPAMLQLIGIGSVAGLGGLGRAAASLFQATHIPLTLVSILSVFLLTMGVQAWLRFSLEHLNTRIEGDFTCFLRERLYRAMVGADWLFFARRRSSDMVQVFTEELQRVGVGTQQLLSLMGTAGVALVQVAIAFVLSPTLTLLAVACGAAVALTLRPLGRRVHELGRTGQQKRSEMAAAVSEHLGGMKTAKSHGWEAHHLAVFSRVVRDIASHWLTTARLQARSRAAYELGAVLALSAFLYCAVAVAHLSPAQVLLLAFIFTRLIPRMVAMQGNWHRVAQTLPSFEAAERLREEFIGAQEPAWPASPSRLVLSSDVTFEGVRFRYNDGGAREALDFTGIAIPAGGVTALCGPSGAGKSTFADLLLGLLRPAEGRILIDGKPLEGDRLHAWRQSVGYVPQETFLFHDTIRANLAMARPDASEADLGAALRAAAAADFVNRLPLGLDTVLGDRGIRLSGGERQRLALARALLRKPTMLVLDEATSSLDSQNEQLIQGALERLHGEMTVVIIAHRLSSVRFANQIVVLKEGSVAEMGKWEELCQREAGLFRQMASAGETA